KEAMELARKAEEARLAAEKEAAEKAAAEKAAAEKAAAERAAAEKAAAEKAAAERAAVAKANTINVFFTIGSSVINKEEGKKIETLVEWLKANPEFTISIVGHADKATGTSKWNMKLSENRAKNVKERLMKLGIPAERINAAFIGDTANQFPENNKNRVVICQVE
ncbi:MAG: OmpA family protein, partial [Bacteroidales bacterium]|nr:OmpA family protein [Bacteroidales bacterium]